MTSPSPRQARIGDAAIALIAERGLRGLTHRAVDRAAGLPAGSTSYYARTRLALLELVCDRLATRDAAQAGLAPAPGGPPVDDSPPGAPAGGGRTPPPAAAGRAPPESVAAAAAAGAAFLRHLCTAGRVGLVARWEVALEATRSPQLRARYNAAGARFRALIPATLARLGSADPATDAAIVTHWCEGVLLDSLIGAGSADPPDERRLRELLYALLTALLARSEPNV